VKDKDFNNLVASIREAGAIRRGERRPSRVFDFKPEDVRALRQTLRKSQTEFALLIGVSVATLRNWEQGRRVPEGPARALLRVAAANPRVVMRALSA
jgi:putative transcriptional regulator